MSHEPPLDEFDALAPSSDGRRGAHRARRSGVAAVLSTALVAGATAAVAGGAFLLVHHPGGSPAQVSSAPAAGSGAVAGVDPAAATSTGTPSPAGTSTGTSSGAVPSATAAADDAAAARAASDAASAAGTAASAAASTAAGPTSRTTASAAATGRVDTTLPLVVLNGTRTAGLAGRASTQLHRQGWKVQSTGNDRSGAASTTVTYAETRMAATAAAVAADLGGSAVQQRSATEGVLTVVLGPDFGG